MSNFKFEMLVYTIVAIIGIVAVVALNRVSNNLQKTTCEKKGGTFFYSLNASHSLCELPKQ